MSTKKLGSAVTGFVNNLSGSSKAVIGFGMVGGADVTVILTALVAAIGIGAPVDPMVLQTALVGVLKGLGAGFLIWLVPNFTAIKDTIVDNFPIVNLATTRE